MTRSALSVVFISIYIATAIFALVAAEPPQFSKSAGFYTSAIDVELTTATEGAEIRYTRDGSEPSGSSILYQGTLHLDSTCVIRAAAYKSGVDSSFIVTHSFFLAEKPELNDLPVLSLVTAPPNLWDPQSGIYANPLESGDEWERPVAIEFFEQQGALGFFANAGIRIHGGASRQPQKSPKKSFRLYFRSEYGLAKLDYPIIPSSAIERFDRLVLRAGYNDSWIHWLDLERELTTYVRDPLVRDVFIAVGRPASHGDFVHLFLNGEYWGLYNISERYDDDFGDAYIGGGDWDVVKPGADEDNNAIEASTGDLVAWNQFAAWFENRDFRIESNYRDLESWIDLDNLIRFLHPQHFYAKLGLAAAQLVCDPQPGQWPLEIHALGFRMYFRQHQPGLQRFHEHMAGHREPGRLRLSVLPERPEKKRILPQRRGLAFCTTICDVPPSRRPAAAA